MSAKRKAAPRAADLLVEIGAEDLPARYVRVLGQSLAGEMDQRLRAADLAHRGASWFATPRRIAVLLKAVPAAQPDRAVERKGPKLAAALKDGQPTQAGLGFAKSCGVAFDALAQEHGQLVYRGAQQGRALADVLPEIFDQALKAMDPLVPRRMRWGSGEETFVRPVQWLACLHGSKVIPLSRFGLKAGNRTFGHRFHAPRAIALKSPAEYARKLRAAKVWADFDSRQAEVRKQAEAEARKLKGQARITEALLEEVAALVEWPAVLSGRIEPRFLELPPEVVIATIEHNQRYFPVHGGDGKLLPHFITVSNIVSRAPKQVVAGNERVVVPRLADAMFFWQQDRKKRLKDFVPPLSHVTYQKDLGTIGDKVARIDNLAVHIAGVLGADAASVRHAALLCKADLVTRMVYEFPELQGVMGAYYARASGEPEETAQAIREHYQPAQSGAPIPSSQTGRILALADRLDTLAGIFAIGQKPSAGKDPFALRRAALGALRICMEGELPLDLRDVLKRALDAQPAGRRDEAQLREIWEFVLERLRAWFAEQDVAPEVFNAVAATRTPRPLDFARRIDAVRRFLKLKEAGQLAAAHKRIRNILKQAGEGDIEVRPDHFRESQERGLFDALNLLTGKVQAAARDGAYTEGLRALAELQQPVDAFFDKVLVLAPEEELRSNRVAMLRDLDRLCRSIADLSCLPG